MKLNGNEMFKKEIEMYIADFKKSSDYEIELKFSETGEMCDVTEDGRVLLTYNVNGPSPDSIYLARELQLDHHRIWTLKDGASPLDLKNGYNVNRKLLS